MRNLIVDGMLSGTGIRDGDAGGYIEPNEVGLSAGLAKRIAKWVLDRTAESLLRYAARHWSEPVSISPARTREADRQANSKARNASS
jgi:hypothetical protein